MKCNLECSYKSMVGNNCLIKNHQPHCPLLAQSRWIPVEDAFFLLVKAVELIRAWHGEVAWEIYYTQSPEMKKIREALDAYPAPPEKGESS